MLKLGLILMMTMAFAAGEWVSLWPGEAPGANRPASGSEHEERKMRITDVEVPQYQLFQPEEPNGIGLVIFPGGGYRSLAIDHEGFEVGEWCAKRGVTAMVVKYRVSRSKDWGYQFPVPLLDARRAIRLMRSHAEEWKIENSKIGVMGFSAGGHLASLCLTLWEQGFDEESGDSIDIQSCRPDFGVLAYPVIGMGVPWEHEGSRKRLLGKDAGVEVQRRCSAHLQVKETTSPVFLVHASDDKAVPLRNATEFMAACAEKGVPVRSVIFPSGGHGFGWEGRDAAAGWIQDLEKWLLTF